MKLTNNWGNRALKKLLLSPNEASSTENGLHIIKYLVKQFS